MSNVKAVTNTDMALVKLNVQAGRPVKEVAAITGMNESVVESLIAEYGWKAEEEADATPESLANQEIKKQLEFAPLYAGIETLMLAKAKDFLESLDTSDPSFSSSYATMAKAVKDLRSMAPPQALQTAAQNQNNQGIQLNIINQF